MRYAMAKNKTFTSRDARERGALIEAARRALPINTYLRMLNHMALTGEMPDVDPMTGTFTGTTEKVSIDMRVDTAKWLVDKCMPNLIRVEPPADDGLKDATVQNTSPDDIKSLTSDMLKALIHASQGAPQHVPDPASPS